MPTFELPDDLAEYLMERATKNGQSAEEFLAKIVYDRRERDRTVQSIDNIAPKRYLNKK